MIIDLEVGQHQITVRLIQAKRFLKAQQTGIELSGCDHVIGPEADVSHADDGWPRNGLRGRSLPDSDERAERSKDQKERHKYRNGRTHSRGVTHGFQLNVD